MKRKTDIPDHIKWETPLKYAAEGAPEGLIINVLH